MSEIVGASFTELTVSTNGSLAERAPSLTVTVIVAVPDWPAAGVTVTVRLAPLPPKRMLRKGTSVGLDDPPLSIRVPAGVWAPPTVNVSGPVARCGGSGWWALPGVADGARG